MEEFGAWSRPEGVLALTLSSARGECEFASETDPAVIRVLLKVTDKGDLRLGRVRGRGAGVASSHYAEGVG